MSFLKVGRHVPPRGAYPPTPPLRHYHCTREGSNQIYLLNDRTGGVFNVATKTCPFVCLLRYRACLLTFYAKKILL